MLAKRFLCYLGSFETVVMKPDNPGEWAVVCRTNDHFEAGMVAKFRVNKCNSKPTTKIPPTKKKLFTLQLLRWNGIMVLVGKIKLNGVNFDTDKYVVYRGREGGRGEGGRGGREGGREGRGEGERGKEGRKEGKDGGRDGGTEGRRDGGKEGREGRRVEGTEGGREGGEGSEGRLRGKREERREV